MVILKNINQIITEELLIDQVQIIEEQVVIETEDIKDNILKKVN